MQLFDVLSDPVRRRILELLGRREMASGEVVEAIRAEFGIQAVNKWVSQFKGFWEPKLDALATEIARGKRERRGTPSAGRRGRRA
jgi:hypothetical protein